MKEAGRKKRVELDKERTLLANERTLLAYLRTGFAAFVFGFALIHFFENGKLTFYIGIGLLILAVIFVIKGIVEYRAEKEKIKLM